MKFGRQITHWEASETIPIQTRLQTAAEERLASLYESQFDDLLNRPYEAPDCTHKRQLDRLRYLVDVAIEHVPLYRRRYKALNLNATDITSLKDLNILPLMTKNDFLSCPPEDSYNKIHKDRGRFRTRSSGSSGMVLPIEVDEHAVLIDTLQGARQLILQSGYNFKSNHLAMNIYTVPWWVDNISGGFRQGFISSLVAPRKINRILCDTQPASISCYPTVLKSLIENGLSGQALKSKVYVTHSEQSTRAQRINWSNNLGAPVLDEYSSEEATRIALELPCGHYHVNEDAVILEVLDPVSWLPVPPGEYGVAVITNLLNEAMPFIRYVQGDFIRKPLWVARCNVTWQQLDAISGRINDAFLTKEGNIVPAGTILDVTYRALFDVSVNVKAFCVIQRSENEIHVDVVPTEWEALSSTVKFIERLRELLSLVLGAELIVTHAICDERGTIGKSRPIRRTFERRQDTLRVRALKRIIG